MLELAILGLLFEAPDARLRAAQTAQRAAGRAARDLLRLPVPRAAPPDPRPASSPRRPAPRRRRAWSRRGRRVYRITAEGKERFAELIADSGPQAFDDDGFGVHLAFFSRTPAEIRMRILEGRRRAVEERRDGLRAVLARAGEQIDRYTRELHQLGLDTTEREVRWLNELIQSEQRAERELRTGNDADPTETTQPQDTPGEL